MKKIISVILFILLMLSATSCGDAWDGTKVSLDGTGWSEPLTGGDGYSATYAYQTFEEYCTSNFVTDVVVATLISRDTFGKDHMKYTFEVKEAILGK